MRLAHFSDDLGKAKVLHWYFTFKISDFPFELHTQVCYNRVRTIETTCNSDWAFCDCLFKCTGFFLAPHCQTPLLTTIENNRRKLHFWSIIKVKFIHVAECMGIMYKQKYCELRTNIALSKMCGKDVHTFVELFWIFHYFCL